MYNQRITHLLRRIMPCEKSGIAHTCGGAATGQSFCVTCDLYKLRFGNVTVKRQDALCGEHSLIMADELSHVTRTQLRRPRSESATYPSRKSRCWEPIVCLMAKSPTASGAYELDDSAKLAFFEYTMWPLLASMQSDSPDDSPTLRIDARKASRR
jgi:hypothetical protein